MGEHSSCLVYVSACNEVSDRRLPDDHKRLTCQCFLDFYRYYQTLLFLNANKEGLLLLTASNLDLNTQEQDARSGLNVHRINNTPSQDVFPASYDKQFGPGQDMEHYTLTCIVVPYVKIRSMVACD